MADKDTLAEAREAFKLAAEAEDDNRKEALDDIRFARLGHQWPDDMRKQRERDGKPCLTINKQPAFIRQVVNDARQNKPQIKVHPVDSSADPETADVMSGIIRNIEYTSNADVAYDTATEHAVGHGFGYFTVDMDYAHDDSFDMDIAIERVADPFKIYGDPNSTAADSSDWMTAFEIEDFTHQDFEAQFKGAEKVDWQTDGYSDLNADWFTDDMVRVAKWWKREEVERPIVLMSDGTVLDVEHLKDPGCRAYYDALGVRVVRERNARSWKVTRKVITGAEVLTDEVWKGRYIPIIPVYGDEVWCDGKRHLRSLIRDAKDAQRMFNYWRTTSTELVALAPRVPFIGPKGAFKTDAAKWASANRVNHPYLEYDGQTPPARQPLDTGAAAGALQEALNASDDMKAIIGLYDASLGARSNETSGKAIMARQREGDVSTFHFQDNMARAIRHLGRVLIDLIPHVYTKERVVRVMGEDGTPDHKPLNTPVPVMDADGQPEMEADKQTGQPIPKTRIYNLAQGKYDLTVTTGPSFTTKREEAATQMTELMRAFPAAAPVIGDLLAKNLDWPGADEIAERLKKLQPGGGGIPPELQKQIEEGQARLQELEAENQALKADHSLDAAKIDLDRAKIDVERVRLAVEKFRAETERMEAMKPDPVGPVARYKAETERFNAMKPEPAHASPSQG